MRTKKTNGHKVVLYDDIAEMPVVRFQRFNKMMLLDSGIGSDLTDTDTHIERALRFMRRGEIPQAMTELENMRMQMYFITENINPQHLAFAALVKSIDGHPCNDLSDAGLAEVRQRLQDMPLGWFQKLLESAKKKIEEDLTTYFPDIFNDTATKEYYDLLKYRAITELDGIIEGRPDDEKIDEITGLLLTFAKPELYSGSTGAEVRYDLQYETMCLLLTKATSVVAKDMTVLEFYNALTEIRRQEKKNNRKGRKQPRI